MTQRDISALAKTEIWEIVVFGQKIGQTIIRSYSNLEEPRFPDHTFSVSSQHCCWHLQGETLSLAVHRRPMLQLAISSSGSRGQTLVRGQVCVCPLGAEEHKGHPEAPLKLGWPPTRYDLGPQEMAPCACLGVILCNRTVLGFLLPTNPSALQQDVVAQQVHDIKSTNLICEIFQKELIPGQYYQENSLSWPGVYFLHNRGDPIPGTYCIDLGALLVWHMRDAIACPTTATGLICVRD